MGKTHKRFNIRNIFIKEMEVEEYDKYKKTKAKREARVKKCIKVLKDKLTVLRDEQVYTENAN